MATHLKTPKAAKALGISYNRLIGLLRADKIQPPEKDSSGDYLWSPQDLDRARQAIAAGRRRQEMNEEAACAS